MHVFKLIFGRESNYAKTKNAHIYWRWGGGLGIITKLEMFIFKLVFFFGREGIMLKLKMLVLKLSFFDGKGL